MTVEAVNPSMAVLASATNHSSRSSGAATVNKNEASAGTAVTPDAAALQAAAQAIQGYLSGHISPPQFSVDYLSGLNVMTVRAAASGEVVFQIPGPTAVQLAQLLNEGVSVESLRILDKTV